MNPMVENIINARNNEKRAAYEKEKNEFLLKNGIFEKVYSSTNEYSSEFPESEWDSASGEYKYYAKKPIEITDEEYEMLLDSGEKPAKRSNKIAGFLRGLAILLYICGGLTALICLMFAFDGDEELLIIGLSALGSAIFAGLPFHGLSEIIRLLHEINNKIK